MGSEEGAACEVQENDQKNGADFHSKIKYQALRMDFGGGPIAPRERWNFRRVLGRTQCRREENEARKHPVGVMVKSMRF